MTILGPAMARSRAEGITSEVKLNNDEMLNFAALSKTGDAAMFTASRGRLWVKIVRGESRIKQNAGDWDLLMGMGSFGDQGKFSGKGGASLAMMAISGIAGKRLLHGEMRTSVLLYCSSAVLR